MDKPKRKLTTEERVKLLETQNTELLASITELKEQIATLQFVRKTGDYRVD